MFAQLYPDIMDVCVVDVLAHFRPGRVDVLAQLYPVGVDVFA